MTFLAPLFISLAIAAATVGIVHVMLRRQRRKLEAIVADFSVHNVNLSKRLTEIVVGQQKKQDAQEEALEKMLGYAIRMRREINILADRAAAEDEYYPDDDADRRILN